MKFIHFGDVHESRKNHDQVMKSLSIIARTGKAASVDAFVVSGDIWDAPVLNTGASFFPAFIEAFRQLADIAPVVMIQGTPSHDADGSLDIFKSLRATNEIVVLRFGECWHCSPKIGKKVLFMGIPEPQKKHLVGLGLEGSYEETLRSFFVMASAERRRYPEAGCIVLYHGQVHGARMSNGESLTSGVRVDDLALIGADYIAMNDIHEPQQVGPPSLNAHYSGSIFPCNWGDGHDAGFNYVTIDDQGTSVKRVSCGHPRLLHLTLPLGSMWAIDPGTKVWLERILEDGQYSDAEAELAALLQAGAHPKSRVTFTRRARETVRAGEMTEKKTLFDKLSLWAENSGKPLPKEIEADLSFLETEAAKAISSPSGHFEVYKLILRGAVGIWKNQKKDEVTVDLRSMDDGMIALVGPNGRGKTTILENFHPWPTLLTRGGALKSHFRLKDSRREVYIFDHLHSVHYKAVILINGASASGVCEYYLYSSTDGQSWSPVGEANGRLATYEAEVKRLFGSLEIFLRTSFVTQKPTASNMDLASAPRSVRTALMAELSGLDQYKAYKAVSTTSKQAVEKKLASSEAMRSALASSLGDLPNLEAEERQLKTVVADREQKLSEAKKEEQSLVDLVAELNVKREEALAQINKRVHLGIRRDGLRSQRTALTEKVKSLRKLADEKDVLTLTLAAHEQTAGRIRELKEQKEKIDQENQAAEHKHRLEAQELIAARNSALSDIQLKKNQRILLEQTLEQTRRDLAYVQAKLDSPVDLVCPQCGGPMSEAQRTNEAAYRQRLEADRNSFQDKVVLHEREILALGDVIVLLEKDLQNMPTSVPAPILQTPLDSDELLRLQDELSLVDFARLRADYGRASVAQGQADQLAEDVTRIESDLAAVEVELAAVPSTSDAIVHQYEDARATLATLQIQVRGHETSLVQAKVALGSAVKAIETWHVTKSSLDELSTTIAKEQSSLARWTFLEEAMGQTGIQALEIDALCPSIAATANDLLASYESGRYRIRFDTTRDSARGVQIEDFLIWVLDSETGLEQEIDTLSGGEFIWIRKALYEAFSVVRERNHNLRFLTAFLDESDSALAPESRVEYLRLLSSPRYKKVLVITHSSELQDLIEQKINVETI